MADYLGLVRQCEDLYADVCFSADSWPDTALSDWIEGIASSTPTDKEVARELRRVLRVAQRLRDFWRAPPEKLPSDHGDWKARVDISQGVKAWRPLLAIARVGLARQPSEEAFVDVQQRFRLVTGERWMEGKTLADWHSANGPG